MFIKKLNHILPNNSSIFIDRFSRLNTKNVLIMEDLAYMCGLRHEIFL